jgi:hypothetical protein
MLSDGLLAVLDALDTAHDDAERLRQCERAGVADPHTLTDMWNTLDLTLMHLQATLAAYGLPASLADVRARQEPPLEGTSGSS